MCSAKGCPKLTQGYRCEAHQQVHRAAVAEYRSWDMDPRYKSERWKRYSRSYRADHPFCAICHVRVTDVVDHIQPVRTHPELFWEPTNHRPACHGCNRREAVAATARGGIGI